jgi:hypothetical protein
MGTRRDIHRWRLDREETLLSICRHHEGRAHYRCCAPPLRAATAGAMEHRHHGACAHFQPHHRDEWQLSAPVVLLGPVHVQGISFPASHTMHAIAKLLSVLDACDCSTQFCGQDLFCTSFPEYSMLVVLGSLQPWPGWDSMLIVAALHEQLLLLLHVHVLFTPWTFRFWQKGHYFF